MDKPLPDWTLREARAYCKAQHCEDCQMHGDDSWSCKINNPTNWDLSGWSKYTPEEIALAKLLLRTGLETVERDGFAGLSLYGNGEWNSRLPGEAFPSVALGEMVSLKDIAESEE
ncbi:MAG: hypothetical protein LUD69_07820 [Oscillospiraceae bacterium]|nr:hypothetical protein [Oscillospiraceae bacterium]